MSPDPGEDRSPTAGATRPGSTHVGPTASWVASAGWVVAGLVAGLGAGRLLRPAPPPPATFAPADPEAAAADDSPVVVSVGARTVTAEQFRLRWQEIISEDARRLHARRGGVEDHVEEVVEELLLAEESERRGLHRQPVIREAWRRESHRIMSRRLLAEEVRAKTFPESELVSLFEARKAELESPLRVRVREIVVTSSPGGGPPETAATDAADPAAARAKIESLRERVLEGEDFEALARTESESPTAANGGLIGWVVEGRFLRSYEEAALAMEPGEVSRVLTRPDGFAILQAEAREEPVVPTFEDARDSLLAELLEQDPGAMQRRYRVFIEELKRRHPVSVDEDALPENL